jgi:hypothetical protein
MGHITRGALVITFAFWADTPALAAEDAPLSRLSVGARTTVSAFSHGDPGDVGLGVGGQLRYRLLRQVDTEWYFDHITTDVDGVARRVDEHIGWSVLLYPVPIHDRDPAFLPYILAGHCFDYTAVTDNADVANRGHRWSAAVQAGVGARVRVTERTDVSFTTQGMWHLGNHLDVETDEHEPTSAGVHLQDASGSHDVHIDNKPFGNLEGHVLFNVSASYRFAGFGKGVR